MRLEGLPYQVKGIIARILDPFYIHTLGSSCSEWRAILRPNQRVLCNRRGDGADYAAFLARFPNAGTLRIYGQGRGLDLTFLGASSLRTLRLAFCTFDPMTFVPMPQLTSLELDTNQLRHAPRLRKMGLLVSLTIRNNMLGSFAPELARALVKLTSLESLDLSRNGIDAAAATALAPGLSALANLRSLDLRRNLLASEGAAALASTFRALTALTALNIDANFIGASGFAALELHGPTDISGLIGLTNRPLLGPSAVGTL